MRLRDSLAHLSIRLALAAFFIWTGGSKLFYTNDYAGEAAATLANMGVLTPPGTPTVPPAVPPAQENLVPPSVPDPAGSEPEVHAPAGALIAAQAGGGTWTGADFDEPVTARRLHTVTLMIKRAAEHGRWPGFLASDQAIQATAWGVCVVEFIGGILVLVGFFTRLACVGLAGAAAGALVFTTILPAMAAGGTFLWILPPHQLENPDAWVMAWSPWLLRFFAFMGALAILLGGPGKLAVDALLFPTSSRAAASGTDARDDDDD